MKTQQAADSHDDAARMRIAVVGSGIAGLGAAWLLSARHDVTLYERGDYFGGHTHTVSVDTADGPLPIDTGFIVHNRRNYPHLSALFDHLGVATQPTDMSFSASVDGGRIEYAGDSLSSLYAQRQHLWSAPFQRMVWDILRFGRLGKQLLKAPGATDLTLGELLEAEGLSAGFRDHYLLPMAAAIWSCPTATMLEFPAMSLLQFFDNHGLLDLRNRPQWRTVSGGSKRYVARMMERFGATAKTDAAVSAVIREGDRVTLRLKDGTTANYDQVVVATHADQALALLDQPDAREKTLLGAFRYQPNRAVLHSDPKLMPKRRRVWSSWNYLSARENGNHAVSVTYWTNRLQRLTTDTPYFVSLNPIHEPSTDQVVAEMDYTHPVFDRQAIASQDQLHRLQGQGRVWFCGSYFGHGFHEDALRSAVAVAQGLGCEIPWVAADGVQGEAPTPMPGVRA